jgi:hypothetical protein
MVTRARALRPPLHLLARSQDSLWQARQPSAVRSFGKTLTNNMQRAQEQRSGSANLAAARGEAAAAELVAPLLQLMRAAADALLRLRYARCLELYERALVAADERCRCRVTRWSLLSACLAWLMLALSVARMWWPLLIRHGTRRCAGRCGAAMSKLYLLRSAASRCTTRAGAPARSSHSRRKS